MSGLLLNDDFALMMIWLVALPLLAVAVVFARSYSSGARREAAARSPALERLPVTDPTPMLEEDPTPVARVTQRGEVVAVPAFAVGADEFPDEGATEVVRAPQLPPPAPSLEARISTLSTELNRERARIVTLEDELGRVRFTLHEARGELGERDRVIEQQAAELQELRALRAELKQAQDALAASKAQRTQAEQRIARLQAELEAAAAPPSLPPPEGLPSADGWGDAITTDPEEIVLAMPASAEEAWTAADDVTRVELPQAPRGAAVLQRAELPGDEHPLSPDVLEATCMKFSSEAPAAVVDDDVQRFSGAAFSVEAWVKAARTAEPGCWLSYDSSEAGFGLFAGGPGPALHIDIGGEPLGDELAPHLIANTWQHVAVVWDRQDGRLTLYIDGALAYSGELAPGTTLPAGGRLVIGADARTGKRPFDGCLAEVRAWSHARTPSTIRRETHRRIRGSADVTIWRVESSR